MLKVGKLQHKDYLYAFCYKLLIDWKRLLCLTKLREVLEGKL